MRLTVITLEVVTKLFYWQYMILFVNSSPKSVYFVADSQIETIRPRSGTTWGTSRSQSVLISIRLNLNDFRIVFELIRKWGCLLFTLIIDQLVHSMILEESSTALKLKGLQAARTEFNKLIQVLFSYQSRHGPADFTWSQRLMGSSVLAEISAV